MTLAVALAAAGLALLTLAADQLVLGSSRLATRLRISPVVVGVVVIGLGTSAPEFLVSGLAAARGETGIAVGSLIGSNVVNLTLILGIGGLVGPLAVRSGTVRREAPAAVVAVAIFGLVVWIGLGVPSGVLLLALLGGALVLLLRWARTEPDPLLSEQVAEFTDETPRPGWGPESARALLGLAGVLAGAQLLVANASAIAVRLGASPLVIGFTLVAIGTSMPELVTAIQAQRRGETDLLVGNLFGSNLFNSLAGGALVGLASAGGPVARAPAALAVVMVFVSLLGWALLRRGLRLTRVEAGVLLLAYALALPLLAG